MSLLQFAELVGDDGPWLARPAGDLHLGEGDYIHCEVDLRGLSPLGTFAMAVNAGPFEQVFEDWRPSFQGR